MSVSIIEEQVPTKRVSIRSIMSSPSFARGFNDVRAGVPFDWRYGAGPNARASWDYERGRLLAHIAPINMPLRIGAQLNPKLVALYKAAGARRLVT
jgi:hypothetical protein